MLPLDQTWYPGTGDPQEPTTGDKAIFGDLGNDYIVAGMCRCRVYGGWGNDLVDLRARTDVDGGLNDGPVPNLDGTFGTPAWESLAYGGAGQDIFFAGTGGDRLIDWVGNSNSFYVPFSQFGMPAVSRTLQPFLPEFLYALSKSDGADPLLAARYAAFDTQYSGIASRNGEPFGELGLVLQHDDAWHEQTGPPFNEMPENLGGVGIDVMKTANVRPFNSPGIAPLLSTLAPRISLPSGLGVNLPSGTNTPGASSVPLVITGTPGSTVAYTFSQGSSKVSGNGAINSRGTFGAVVDLSAFADGTITVTATLTLAGKTTTLTGTMGKNSLAPSAPTVAAAVYANLATEGIYNVTVTGQAGSIATVVIADSGTPIAGNANGMDMVGANGTVTIPIDVSNLLDGPITLVVTLTNGAGDSTATTLTVTKDTVPPVLSVSTPPYVNNANASSFQVVVSGEPGATSGYTITDGTTTITNNRGSIPASGKWNANMNLTSLKDGPLTLTISETDPAGNPTTQIVTLLKRTVAPAAPTVGLNPLDDSGSSSSDYVTSVATPRFNVTSASGTTTTVYVNGVVYTGQKLADGSYTVTAVSTDAYGNTSTGTAARALVVDTAPPTGSFSISGAKTIGGQLAVNTQALTLSLALSGGGSTMWQLSFSTDGGATFSAAVAYASSASVTLPSANGLYTVVVRATDAAGNVATFTQIVRLDTIGPTIGNTITAPTNNGAYDLGTNPTLTYSAADVDGVGTISAKLDSSTAIASGGTINLYTLTAGTHTIVITATDGLGNVSTVTVTFQVHVTIAGLVNAVTYGVGNGSIASSLQSSLLSTLNSAQSALNKGDHTTAKSYLNTFVSQVQSGSSGKKISSTYAALLVSWTQDLIARL